MKAYIKNHMLKKANAKTCYYWYH